MGSLAVHLGQQVENEGLHVEVQRLVVQEQLGQQAEVLAVDLGGSGRGGGGQIGVTRGHHRHVTPPRGHTTAGPRMATRCRHLYDTSG